MSRPSLKNVFKVITEATPPRELQPGYKPDSDWRSSAHPDKKNQSKGLTAKDLGVKDEPKKGAAGNGEFSQAVKTLDSPASRGGGMLNAGTIDALVTVAADLDKMMDDNRTIDPSNFQAVAKKWKEFISFLDELDDAQ